MGGGRDHEGAALYKRVGGKYIRVSPYNDKEKEAGRLISEIIDRPIDSDSVHRYFDDVHGFRDKDAVIVTERPLAQMAVLKYLRAIDSRDKNAVIALDKKLKNGDFGTGADQKKISNIRKVLLELAADSPEKVTAIRNISFHNAAKMITVKEKLKELQNRFIGKKVRLKNDVRVGWFDTYINSVYPKGLEGAVLKIRSNVKKLPNPDNGMKLEKVVSYDFLLQWEDGYKKWIYGRDIETID